MDGCVFLSFTGNKNHAMSAYRQLNKSSGLVKYMLKSYRERGHSCNTFSISARFAGKRQPVYRKWKEMGSPDEFMKTNSQNC